MANFYDILGVGRSASLEEIRAAYRVLIKRHHPDSAGVSAETRAKEITRAFATLRDPDKRAVYDAELRRSENAHQRSLPAEAFPPPRQPPPRRPGLWAAALIAPPLVALILIAAGSIGGSDAVPQFSLPPRDGMEAEPSQPQVRAGDVADAVSDVAWIAGQGNAADALRYSRSCFALLEDEPAFRLLDRCVAFDLASHFALTGEMRRATGSFFTPEGRRARHEAALRLVSFDEAANHERLLVLERLALSEIARTMNESGEPVSDPILLDPS
ncbi:MAG: J domain-containing protein [Pseudomonadota bacterium]|nr:J domain-containing protein [Pseudomonadota bacterium]